MCYVYGRSRFNIYLNYKWTIPLLSATTRGKQINYFELLQFHCWLLLIVNITEDEPEEPAFIKKSHGTDRFVSEDTDSDEESHSTHGEEGPDDEGTTLNINKAR